MIHEAMAGFLIEMGGMQQSLRRDAAFIQASTPKGGAFFHTYHLKPKLSRPNRCYIATRPSAYDDDVRLLCHKGFSFFLDLKH
jgi:hypothetical protein